MSSLSLGSTFIAPQNTSLPSHFCRTQNLQTSRNCSHTRWSMKERECCCLSLLSLGSSFIAPKNMFYPYLEPGSKYLNMQRLPHTNVARRECLSSLPLGITFTAPQNTFFSSVLELGSKTATDRNYCYKKHAEITGHL